MERTKQKFTQSQTNVDKETLKKWKEDVGSFPKALTNEENLQLLKKYKETGDIKIRNELVCGNLRFAVSFSYKYFQNLIYKFYFNQNDDLVQDLSLFIMGAVEKFDLSKGESFCAFLRPEIRHKFLNKFNCAKNLKNNAVLVSFYSPAHYNKDGDELTYEDVLMDERFTEENLATDVDVNHILKNIIPRLAKRERFIFNKCFVEGKTQIEVAKTLNLSREYVSRLVGRIKTMILDAYENGVEVLPIVEEPLEICPTTFEQALKLQGKEEQEVLTDYFKGELGLHEIAKKHNIKEPYISFMARDFKKFCVENNIEFPKRMRVDPFVDARAERNKNIWEDWLKGGKSIAEIAKHYSVSRGTVQLVITKFKAERLQRGEEVPKRTKKLKSSKVVKNADQVDMKTALKGMLSALSKEEVLKDDNATEQNIKEKEVAGVVANENYKTKERTSSTEKERGKV